MIRCLRLAVAGVRKFALGVALCGLLGVSPALAQPGLEVRAPEPLKALLLQHLDVPAVTSNSDAADRVHAARVARKQAGELLQTEGYFSPVLNWSLPDSGLPVLDVEPGPRVLVRALELQLKGALVESGDPALASRAQALRDAWSLRVGEPFRQADWDAAKQALLQGLRSRDFAAAYIVESQAEVDPATASAKLTVLADSGPAFTLGALQIEGLEHYPRELVLRYSRLSPGQPYSEEKLLDLQRALQNAPYFGAVVVDIDTQAIDPQQVPVRVRVTEAKTRRLSFGMGYSSNNGARVETLYRDANLWQRGWQLSSGVRVDQTGQLAFADVFLPPNADDWRDGFGVLTERDLSQGLSTRRMGLGLQRSRTSGRMETRYALQFQTEWREVESASNTASNALVLDGSWIWRNVDNPLDPREGQVLALRFGGASKALLSERNFMRTHVRAQQYWSPTARDLLTARAEVGVTSAASREGIPEEYLFRTGGAQTVRGYAYRSIGTTEGTAIVGGRYLLAATLEYVHWWSAQWGTAVFQDVGNAADAPSLLRPLKSAAGLGARWRSPAGPLAFDLAFNQQTRTLRASFSIAIAF